MSTMTAAPLSSLIPGGLGSLQSFCDNPLIAEIMVVGGRHVWVEERGCIRRVGELMQGEFDVLVERLLRSSRRRLDLMSPIVEARLPDNSRLCAVLPPVSVDGGSLNIRRFTSDIRDLEQFCSDHHAAILRQAVRDRRNIVVSGATSSGKTSLLASLAAQIDSNERVVCIEDTAELPLHCEHLVRLEGRPPNIEGQGHISMQVLVRTALRLRPDRIVVGEVRGAEVVDMLTALHTGHRGCWTTCHSTSLHDTPQRLATMAITSERGWDMHIAHDMVRSSIDVIVHMQRHGERRVVASIGVFERMSDGSVRLASVDN
ncbi:MAG: CpaF family protein [Actinobacteria bacterium]|nr:CpaF family protein [Actinomycetota bacterium]